MFNLENLFPKAFVKCRHEAILLYKQIHVTGEIWYAKCGSFGKSQIFEQLNRWTINYSLCIFGYDIADPNDTKIIDQFEKQHRYYTTNTAKRAPRSVDVLMATGNLQSFLFNRFCMVSFFCLQWRRRRRLISHNICFSASK